MKRKNIFIYLSFVVSAITFLTSTGRAQGPKDWTDPRAQRGSSATIRPQGNTELDNRFKEDLERAIALSLAEEEEKRALALSGQQQSQGGREETAQGGREETAQGACALRPGNRSQKSFWTENDLLVVSRWLMALTKDDETIISTISNNLDNVSGELDKGNLSAVLDKICRLIRENENKIMTGEIVWRIIREDICSRDPLPLAADPSPTQKVPAPDADQAHERLLQEQEDHLYALSLENQR